MIRAGTRALATDKTPTKKNVLIDRYFRPVDGFLLTGGISHISTALAAGETNDEEVLDAVVGAVLALGPALLVQDVVTGVKDLGEDVDKGAKKTAKGTEKAAQDCRRYERRCQKDYWRCKVAYILIANGGLHHCISSAGIESSL
jgi:hypothetical protein